jgi:SAM-dependent methyltransferase
VTTPSLYKPRAPLRPALLPAWSPRVRGLDDEVRAAAVEDLLQPYLFDDAAFQRMVCDEVSDPVSRPRIVEFGCRTGHWTTRVLAARPDAVYHGFDTSEARAAVATCKLARQAPGGSATLTAPLALNARAIGEALQGLRADFLLLPRFLQTVPLCATDETGLHRVSFLALCRQLVKPGGRLFIVEDVYGEDAVESVELARASRDAFRARLIGDLERVRNRLRRIDPALAGGLARLPGDPRLLGELQDRVRPPGASQILPLTAWQRMFEHLGFTYRTVAHDVQRQLFLFVVRC